MLDFDKCPCSGTNLDRLIQPLILINLAKEELNGYKLIQRIAQSPMFKGQKPDGSGIYRYLKAMEQRGLVVSSWSLDQSGPAKRNYRITNTGLDCISNWIATLEEYQRSIEMLVEEAHRVYSKVKHDKGKI